MLLTLMSPSRRQSICCEQFYCSHVPIIAHMTNLSFTECCFPAVFKIARVLPLLKKVDLDKEQMSAVRL